MDRTTKFLLVAIALGLWANVSTVFLSPAAPESDLTEIRYAIGDIGSSIDSMSGDISLIFEKVLDPKPIALCDLLSHPDDRLGEYVAVRGTIENLEHGTYLDADSGCGGAKSSVFMLGNDWPYTALPAARKTSGFRRRWRANS